MGRPHKDRVQRTYTIDRESAEYVDSLPDGERSNFVSAALKAAIGENKMRWTARKLEKTLEQYLSSEDFKQGVIDSTKASWGGSCYKVEILPDGTWQNLWANQIGNRYETPGVIIALPALNCDDMSEFTDNGGTEDEYLDLGFDNERDQIEAELRDALTVNR